jgi:hypothetical protein
MYGDFINAIISFIFIAGVVYFCIVVPMNTFMKKMGRVQETEESNTKPCPFCETKLDIEAKRCRACTSLLPAGFSGTRRKSAKKEKKHEDDVIDDQIKDQLKDAESKINEEGG